MHTIGTADIMSHGNPTQFSQFETFHVPACSSIWGISRGFHEPSVAFHFTDHVLFTHHCNISKIFYTKSLFTLRWLIVYSSLAATSSLTLRRNLSLPELVKAAVNHTTLTSESWESSLWSVIISSSIFCKWPTRVTSGHRFFRSMAATKSLSCILALTEEISLYDLIWQTTVIFFK